MSSCCRRTNTPALRLKVNCAFLGYLRARFLLSSPFLNPIHCLRRNSYSSRLLSSLEFPRHKRPSIAGATLAHAPLSTAPVLLHAHVRVGYALAATGSCLGTGAWIESKAVCEAAAASLGLPDTTAAGNDFARNPYGCYYKNSTKTLYWGLAGGKNNPRTDRVSVCSTPGECGRAQRHRCPHFRTWPCAISVLYHVAVGICTWPPSTHVCARARVPSCPHLPAFLPSTRIDIGVVYCARGCPRWSLVGAVSMAKATLTG